MWQEIQTYHPNNPVRSEKAALVPESSRVVVYGSRLSGARLLTDGIQEHLQAKGINLSVELVRDASFIDQAFHNISDNADRRTLPSGVVIFPQMRQYYGDQGMMIDTYGTGAGGHIEDLREQNGVPFVRAKLITEPELALEEGIKELFSPHRAIDK